MPSVRQDLWWADCCRLAGYPVKRDVPRPEMMSLVNSENPTLDTAAAPEREVLTYQGFGTGARELAQTIADSGFVPDILLGIARGGLIPAGALAYALECKNLFTISVEFYTGVNARLDVPVMLPPFLNAKDLDDATVLIVDDVADTGRTLELVHQFCEGHVAHSRTAVLYEKPQSVIKADYVWRRTDRWIDFPWSSMPTVTSGTARP